MASPMHTYISTSSRHGASVEAMKLQQEQELEQLYVALEPRAPLRAKKRRDPGRCVLGVLMILAGVVSVFHFTPAPYSLVVAPIAILIGAATTSAWQCGHCRPRIDRDSIDCPRCGAPFSQS